MPEIPAALIRSLRQLSGFDETAFLEAHSEDAKVVSIRMNPQKLIEPPFAGAEKIPWSSNGFYLPERPFFTFDPLLHAGAYYVQEPSSMFLEQCLRQHCDLSSSLRVLDLCAAPGGKSTLLLSLINDESLLVSNEVIKSRANILGENLTKWSAPNLMITNNDPRDLKSLTGFFDVMVIDAPCSGSGLFRRDPSAIAGWSTSAVESCSMRQQRILADSYASLSQDGLLVYSTCSYSFEENEDICDWLCQQFELEPLSLSIPKEWNILETTSGKAKAFGYRFLPDKLRGEGFFIACFRKKDGEPRAEGGGRRSKLKTINSRIPAAWVNDAGKFDFYILGEDIFAIPQNLRGDIDLVNADLYTKMAGTEIGRIVKNELVPAHALAVSPLIQSSIQSISLNKEEALQYLRKEEVALKEGGKGWALVRYCNMNLGWVKSLHNRMNNYYPKEWRILKSADN